MHDTHFEDNELPIDTLIYIVQKQHSMYDKSFQKTQPLRYTSVNSPYIDPPSWTKVGKLFVGATCLVYTESFPPQQEPPTKLEDSTVWTETMNTKTF